MSDVHVCCHIFMRGVADEGILGIGGLRQAQVAGTEAANAVRRQKRRELLQLALVVGRDQKPVASELPHQTAAFCAATSSAMPLSARSRSWVISSRLKVAPSADICTSTSRPRPVMMKLPSVPASLSSA